MKPEKRMEMATRIMVLMDDATRLVNELEDADPAHESQLHVVLMVKDGEQGADLVYSSPANTAYFAASLLSVATAGQRERADKRKFTPNKTITKRTIQ